jgi:hypothetical protein
MVYGMSAKWAPGVEAVIFDEIKKLTGKLGVKQISQQDFQSYN